MHVQVVCENIYEDYSTLAGLVKLVALFPGLHPGLLILIHSGFAPLPHPAHLHSGLYPLRAASGAGVLCPFRAWFIMMIIKNPVK